MDVDMLNMQIQKPECISKKKLFVLLSQRISILLVTVDKM